MIILKSTIFSIQNKKLYNNYIFYSNQTFKNTNNGYSAKKNMYKHNKYNVNIKKKYTKY